MLLIFVQYYNITLVLHSSDTEDSSYYTLNCNFCKMLSQNVRISFKMWTFRFREDWQVKSVGTSWITLLHSPHSVKPNSSYN